MINSFIIIIRELSVVFILILSGFIGGKSGLITRSASDCMADILFYYVTPATAIISLQRSYDPEMLRQFFLCLLIAGIYYVCAIIAALLTIRDPVGKRKTVLVMCTVFSNLGMLALPLQQQLFGSDGVFYGMAFVTAANLLMWSYGAVTMSGSIREISLSKMFLNPGFIGAVAGLVLFIFSVKLPAVVSSSLTHISNLMLPVGMLVIGERLSAISFRSLIGDRGALLSSLERLVIFPVIMIASFYFLGIKGAVPVCAVIGYSSPAASSISIMAIRYGQDADLATKTVSMQMVLSMITMPILLSFAFSMLT